ncbi:MAG: protein kinase [Acidobacteriota bacterium]
MDWERRALERAVSRGFVDEADAERIGSEGASGRDVLRRLLDEDLLSAADFMEVLQEVQGVPRQVAQVELDPTVRDASSSNAPQLSDGEDVETTGEEFGDYLLQEEIGRGGVGRVLRAYDRRLKRTVAVKLLDRPDDVASVRFLREAQNQARIEHPNVCKVYDAGEIDGRLYIAMQLIEGKRLDKILRESSVEEKVRVLRDVALGVHAAHRQGLVHRDLKPSNVMVERLRDGKLHPYVTDFGVAREIGTSGLTQTGAVIGTPAFMAPEQVQGRHDALDRRTDVYGLGATLYHLLRGTPPFDSDSTINVLTRVLDEEPEPLRTVVPSLSRDLDSIVNKCLEKEPWRRYESARALADDLDRFLDGQPVRARQTGWFGRLQRRARRRPKLYGVGALGLLALLGLSVTLVLLQLRSRDQRALAQRLGRQVERIDWVSRAAKLAPLHDLTEGRQRLRQEIEVLDSAVGRSKWQRAAVDSAAGRGLLALGDVSEALERLERAWLAGERGAEMAIAKANAHLETIEILERGARNLPDEAAEERRLEQIDRLHLVPAKQLAIEASNVGGPQAALLRARIAEHDERYDDAEEFASAARSESPWLYEGRIVEGDIVFEKGRSLVDEGKYQQARSLFAQAEGFYRKAAASGRSDPQTHQRLCDAIRQQVNTFLRDDRPVGDELVRRGLEHCDAALAADPRNHSALHTKADFYYSLSERDLRNGKDPVRNILEIKRLARRALDSAPAVHDALYLLAQADNRMIEYSINSGQDARPWYESANLSLTELLEKEPRHFAGLRARGEALMGLGRFYAGRKALDLAEQAVEAIRRAVEIAPEDVRTQFELGNALLIQGSARAQLGLDPTDAFRDALAAYGASLELNPNQPRVHGNSAIVDLQLARWAWTHGEDPMGHTESARRSVETARGTEDYHPIQRFNVGESFREEALYRHLQGLDPTQLTALSRDSYNRGLEEWDFAVAAYVDVARSWRVDAEYLLEQGSDPAAAVSRALRSVGAALERDDDKDSAFVERAFSRTALAAALRGGARPGAGSRRPARRRSRLRSRAGGRRQLVRESTRDSADRGALPCRARSA